MVPVFSCHDADDIAQRQKEAIKVHQTMHVDAQEEKGKGLMGGGGRKRRKLNRLRNLIWGAEVKNSFTSDCDGHCLACILVYSISRACSKHSEVCTYTR